MLLTQILSSMTVMLCMLIDSIVIGRFLGVDSMTAYGFSTPILLVFAALGNMVSAGVQVLCGKAMGSGDRKGAHACFSVSVFIMLAISVVGVAGVMLFTDQICEILGAGKPTPDNDVFFLTKDYLRGFIIGAPAFLSAQIMVPYMQISGERLRLVIAVALMTVSDIIFDILNVLVFDGGTFGMGLASSLSYYIAFIIGVLYFFKRDCLFRFRLRLIKAKVIGHLIRDGMPTLINQISLVLLMYSFNTMLADVGGNHAVAAYSVISSVGNICYSFGSGIAAVALMLSSIFYSDEDRGTLIHLVFTMTTVAIVICGAVTALVLIFAEPMVMLFLNDADAKGMAITGLRFFALSLVPCAINTNFKNFYQGIDRAVLTQAISILQNFALTALAAFVLSRFMGVNGIWMGFVTGETLTLVVISAIVFISRKKVKISGEAFSLLPDSFGQSDHTPLEMMLTSPEDVEKASAAVAGYCRENGLGEGLDTELPEDVRVMCQSIVENGFAGRKKRWIEMRLIDKNGTPVLRIRDNCESFNPYKYLKQTGKDLSRISVADYANSLGLNSLKLIY
ncbi:MAG: hypothetical protein IKP95_11855 [Ruminococcus sp.]|nr:hypothetical protein [Ruminococcus sp.]